MAETTNPATQERADPARKVTVTNMYRDQPILFHVLGGSVRLGPFETRELDSACLASPEVSDLMHAGVLRVQESEKQDDAAPGERAQRQSRQPRSGGRRREAADDDSDDPKR